MERNNKKILCLVIPSLQAGGMERVMSELAGYFCQKDDLEIHLVLYGRKPEIFYTIPDNLIIHKPRSKFNDTFRFVASLGRMIYLRDEVKTIIPDSVLSFGEYWNSFVLLGLYGLHYPVYISDRCSPKKKFSTFHSILRRWLYPKAKGVIAQTEKGKQIYASQFRHQNIRVIGNPIRQINNHNSQIQKENVVLTVGRLIKSKHHDRLIELFVKLNLPDWKMIIVGYDHLKQNNSIILKELIRQLNAGDKVYLEGKIQDVDSYYLKSKIFALASDSEGFPNVIAEAMSAGLPVVAFDCVAGPSEMITNNDNGFLIPIFDYDQFQSKLKILITDSDLREKFGVKAMGSIKRFSIDRIGEQYLQFIIGNN